MAPVVQKEDSTNDQINLHLFVLILIRWIAIYPEDSTIQFLNNQGQVLILI